MKRLALAATAWFAACAAHAAAPAIPPISYTPTFNQLAQYAAPVTQQALVLNQLPGSACIAVIGDSRGQQMWATIPTSGVPTSSKGTNGLNTWVETLTNGQFIFPAVDNYAVSGTTSTAFLASLTTTPGTSYAGLQNALNGTSYTPLTDPCPIVYVLDPTNDFAGAPVVAAATTISNMNTIFTTLRAAGKIVISQVSGPRGYSGANNILTSGLSSQYQYNNWLKQNAPRLGVLLVDHSPDWWDPSQAGYQVAAPPGVSYDGLHPSSVGAYYWGSRLASVLQSVGRAQDFQKWNADDVYDATVNTRGNILNYTTAGLAKLQGTGGSTASCSTATVAGTWAANWKMLCTTATGLTITGTSANNVAVTTTSGSTVNMTCQQIAVTGTSSTGGSIELLPNATFSSTQINSGDTLFASAYVKVAASQTNIDGIALIAWVKYQIGAGGSTAYSARIGDNNYTSSDYPTQAWQGLLVTPSITIPATNTTVDATSGNYSELKVYFRQGAATSLTVNYCQPFYGKII